MTSSVDSSDFPRSSSLSGKPHRDDSLNSVIAEPAKIAQGPRANSVSDSIAETRSLEKSTGVPKKIGVEALDDSTLRVTLESPDRDFPKLVANPVFRPVYGDGVEFDRDPLDSDIVTNGPFTVSSVANDTIVLNRSDTYWDKAAVRLEHVKFVFKENAEAALDAYKKGEIDALTNAEFEPLAVKILSPYDDFRQTTHSAVNLYEFNTQNPPFNDVRVRKALAISIDRIRITDGELERTARPAVSFLPLEVAKNTELSFDIQEAKKLLESAGFAAGAAFPKVRLLVNRNDTQQRVARLVARMWKQNLNIDTEIIVKELSEMDAARASGGYDLIRRGIVLPTMDQAAGMTAIFDSVSSGPAVPAPAQQIEKHEREIVGATGQSAPLENIHSDSARNTLVSEDDAISGVFAIPLYFPMAYSLVKPYVRGFEIDGLEATTLQNISIDSDWKPTVTKGAS